MSEYLKMSHEDTVDMALSMYIGYECTICGHEFNSIEDINNRNPKCSGKDESGIKLACGECFNKEFALSQKTEVKKK